MHWIRRHHRGRPPHPDILTPAEWRVLEHIRQDLPNAEIAVRLGVSINTVRAQVSSILAKTGLSDRHALAAWDGRPADASRSALTRFGLGTPLGWLGQAGGLARIVAVGGLALAGALVVWYGATVALGGSDGSGGAVATPTPTEVTEATPTPEAPYRQTFAAGEPVNVAPAVIFVEPDTGDAEAWVFPSHSGEFGVARTGDYIVWRDHDSGEYRLFRTDDETDRSIPSLGSLPIAYGPNNVGFIAAAGEDAAVVRPFYVDGDPGPGLEWRSAPSYPVAANWSPDGEAIAIAQNLTGTFMRMAFAVVGSEPFEYAFEVPEDSHVSLRWSRDGERLALVTADRVRVFDLSGAMLWEFSGDFHGNPRWSPDNEHLYVNAMPNFEASVLHLFTADGEPVFRYWKGFTSACAGDVWLDDSHIHFGRAVVSVTGDISEASQAYGVYPDLSRYGVTIDAAIGSHLVHWADEFLETLDDGRLIVTTPRRSHGGCATELGQPDVDERLERPPFD